MTRFPDRRILMDNLVADGDTAEYHWTLTGTNPGAGGVGNRVRISGLSDGRWEGMDRTGTHLIA